MEQKSIVLSSYHSETGGMSSDHMRGVYVGVHMLYFLFLYFVCFTTWGIVFIRDILWLSLSKISRGWWVYFLAVATYINLKKIWIWVQVYEYLYVLYGLYTEFEKSKTKNTNSQLFFTTEFLMKTPWYSREEYHILEYMTFSLAFSAMDTHVISRWDLEKLFCILSVHVRYRLWYHYRIFHYLLFSPLPWKKRTYPRVCPISPLRRSGDSIYRCDHHDSVYPYDSHIYELYPIRTQWCRARNRFHPRTYISVSYFTECIFFLTAWEKCSRITQLSLEKRSWWIRRVSRYPFSAWLSPFSERFG